MSIIHCQYCGGWLTNRIEILHEHQYSGCDVIRRRMVKKAIALKGIVYEPGSSIDSRPLDVDDFRRFRFVEDKEDGKLKMSFDFGEWHIIGNLQGRSTSVIEWNIK